MEQTAAAAAYKRNIARERQHTWPHCVPPTLLTGNLAGHRAPSGHHPPPPASLPTCLRADPPVLPTPQVPLHPLPFHPLLIHSLFIHPSVTRPLRLPTSQFHLHQITYILWAGREREYWWWWSVPHWDDVFHSIIGIKGCASLSVNHGHCVFWFPPPQPKTTRYTDMLQLGLWAPLISCIFSINFLIF